MHCFIIVKSDVKYHFRPRNTTERKGSLECFTCPPRATYDIIKHMKMRCMRYFKSASCKY